MSEDEATTAQPLLVRRSAVAPGKGYQTYREELRRDFCHACAYCTMAELEAMAISYHIDHYQPQDASGTDDYANLYWTCYLCNGKKKGYWPDATAYAAGHRFLRVDIENPDEHLETDPTDPTRLIDKTELGKFNLLYLELNAARLKKLRKIRSEAGYSAGLIRSGLRSLSSMRLDEIPPQMKARAMKLKDELRRSAEDVEIAVDEVLSTLAVEASKSELIDPDDDPTATRERRTYLRGIGVLKPKAKPKKK